MGRTGFILRNLSFFRRSHAALLLGVVVGTATLTGALLVGDSVRASLRETMLGRLGRVDQAMVAPRFFREALAEKIAESTKAGGTEQDSAHEAESEPLSLRFVPAILARGGVTQADTQARVDHVQVLGVDSRFWGNVPAVEGGSSFPAGDAFAGRIVALNEPLAEALGAGVGDDVLVRMGSADPVPTETLLGRRDQRSTTIRLTVKSILPARGVASFGLDARQVAPRNAFVPLATLQRALEQEGRANAILVTDAVPGETGGSDDTLALLQNALRSAATLDDLGLTLRHDETRAYYSLGSDALLIDPAVEEAAMRAGAAAGFPAVPVLTYLANEIRLASREGNAGAGTETSIPYSTITAVDLSAAIPGDHVRLANGSLAPQLGEGDIFLNQWAADDLGAEVGDHVVVTYYITDAFGALQTESARFILQGVLPMSDAIADSGWTPAYKGITDTNSLSEWNAPFPIDLSKIRPKDDAYWEKYRAAPKAFVSLATGRRLWAHDGERFGASTSIRFTDTRAQQGGIVSEARLEEALLREVDLSAMGLRFLPVHADALKASRGSTDFGMLFIGFSFFLVVSAAMLMALLFRLGVERRAGEIGLLLAVGCSPRVVARLLLGEGASVAVMGSAMGVCGAGAYAWAMLSGLNTWWSAAVGGTFLRLHMQPGTLLIGGVTGALVAVAALAWSIRGLTRRSPRALLAGNVEPTAPRIHATRGKRDSTRMEGGHGHDARRSSIGWIRGAVLVAGSAAAVALAVAPLFSTDFPEAFAFFGSGSALLAASLAAVAIWLNRPPGIVHRPGQAALWRLGARNAPRHRGRSLLTAGLIATATFLIAALQAFEMRPPSDPTDRRSGTGGFTLVAEAAVPLPFSLSTSQGRESLNISEETSNLLAGAEIIPLRLRPGDESSCLNLYQPKRPRIVGAGDALINRGGFAFSSTLAETQQERANPWLLLRRTFEDGAIPAIADEAAVMWQLHSGLGKDLIVTDGRGQPRRLRFVALLTQSVLQDEIVVSDSAFTQLFPNITGHGFFLIDVPPDRSREVSTALERDLSAYAFDATESSDRLARYLAVQNTYLATFQTLGGLGLLLGSCGLAVVLLRNVWERRSELALMRALGFSRASLGIIVLAENVALVIAGLAAGVVPAMLAIAPHLVRQPGSINWTALLVAVGGVLIVGIGAGALALRPTLRAPLLRALRTE
ncbi:MAG: FtsX-like permease family protein [Phycisphaerae bacterium]|nr:FtsX-like permease family protein [Phycisphaerae bacterium]